MSVHTASDVSQAWRWNPREDSGKDLYSPTLPKPQSRLDKRVAAETAGYREPDKKQRRRGVLLSIDQSEISTPKLPTFATQLSSLGYTQKSPPVTMYCDPFRSADSHGTGYDAQSSPTELQSQDDKDCPQQSQRSTGASIQAIKKKISTALFNKTSKG